MSIKVKAIAPGYYKGRRRIDDEFNVDKAEDVGAWMEKVKVEPEAKGKKAQANDKPADDLV